MLPISVGILAWHSGATLTKVLSSYQRNGFFDIVGDVTILFQEVREEDILIAEKFGLGYIGLDTNVGIGKGFVQLAEKGREQNILLLEHDWKLVESKAVVLARLRDSLSMLDSGYHCVRLRHRKNYGYPHFSINRYKGNELDFYDDWIKFKHPHLLDSIHWKQSPNKIWPDKIQKVNDFFVSKSRYANWTNNPCLFKKSFYLEAVKPFVGDGIMLEENISYWWARQDFNVAHGEGLFQHSDIEKYGHRGLHILKKIAKTILRRK